MVGKHFLNFVDSPSVRVGPGGECTCGGHVRNLGSPWAPFLGAVSLSMAFPASYPFTAQTSRAVRSPPSRLQRSARAISWADVQQAGPNPNKLNMAHSELSPTSTTKAEKEQQSPGPSQPSESQQAAAPPTAASARHLGVAAPQSLASALRLLLCLLGERRALGNRDILSVAVSWGFKQARACGRYGLRTG